MDWFLSAIDRLIAAIWVATFAIVASQADPFAAQYSARTAQHLSLAEAHLSDVQTGVRYQTMAANVRADLEAKAQQELAQWQRTHDAVANTMPLLKPIALWRTAHGPTLDATWRSFVPALPVTTWGIIDTILGLLIGFLVYEAVKWPLVLLFQARPRRRFKKRTI